MFQKTPARERLPLNNLISSTLNLTLDGASGNDTLTQAGPIPVPVIFNGGGGNDTLNINAGVFTLAGNPATASSNLTINDSGSLFFTASALESGINVRQLAGLNILAGGSVIVDTPHSAADRAVVVVNSLSIAPTGLLDLTGNDLIVHKGNLTTLDQQVQSGFDAPDAAWKGTTGITSSLAAVDSTHMSALGIIANNTGGSAALNSTFDGQTAIATDVLIKYTTYGDTNLDGKIDATDYSRIDSGSVTHATGWANGDFNYDGTINGSDYTLVDNAFNTQPTAAATAPAFVLPIE